VSTWHTSAPCASADPEAWFPEGGEVPRDARQVCFTCPYRQECLDEAIALGPSHGWWGGKSARQIRRIRIELGLEIPRVFGTDEACPAGHLREGNTRVRPDGRKSCIECDRDYSRRSRARKQVAA
jgi:WhiB family redox-sensing transcriptional regulator